MTVQDPAHLLAPEVLRRLRSLPVTVTTVQVGGVRFDLRARFDAVALGLLLDTCARLGGPEPRWAGRPLPPSLAEARQRQSRTRVRLPSVRPST